MQTKKRYVVVGKNQAEKIKKALSWKEGDDEKNRFGEDMTSSITAVFEDGYEVDVKCCGVQYEENESAGNSAWTEAVLFLYGREVYCTSVEETFFGIWELESAGMKYLVEVFDESDDSFLCNAFCEEATDIIECFEEVLNQYDIYIPDEDDDERDIENNTAKLYGMTYANIYDQIQDSLVTHVMKLKNSDTDTAGDLENISIYAMEAFEKTLKNANITIGRTAEENDGHTSPFAKDIYNAIKEAVCLCLKEIEVSVSMMWSV